MALVFVRRKSIELEHLLRLFFPYAKLTVFGKPKNQDLLSKVLLDLYSRFANIVPVSVSEAVLTEHAVRLHGVEGDRHRYLVVELSPTDEAVNITFEEKMVGRHAPTLFEFFVSPVCVSELLTLLGKHLPESEFLRQGLGVISKLSSLFSSSTYPVNLVSVHVPFVWGTISRFGHHIVESSRVSTLFERLGIDVGVLLSNRESVDDNVLSALEKKLRFLRGLRKLGISGSSIGIIDVKFLAEPYATWSVSFPEHGVHLSSSGTSSIRNRRTEISLTIFPPRKLEPYLRCISKLAPFQLSSKYLYIVYVCGNTPDLEQAILRLRMLSRLNIVENWKKQIRETIHEILKILREK